MGIFENRDDGRNGCYYGLGELIENGGVYYDVEGSSPRETLGSLINALALKGEVCCFGNDIPPSGNCVPQLLLLQAVMEREALMSTSIGYGIAIPHPRNPLIDNPKGQFASLAFLKQPVDWNSIDRKPVDTLLLVVSASAKMHLRTLSKITFFSREEKFQKLLKERAPKEEIIKYIKDTEGEWK